MEKDEPVYGRGLTEPAAAVEDSCTGREREGPRWWEDDEAGLREGVEARQPPRSDSV